MVVEITAQSLQNTLLGILNGTISREEADRWAYSIVRAADVGQVTFVPREDRERIWAGVMYLYGVDIMEAPGEYLHDEDDLRRAIARLAA